MLNLVYHIYMIPLFISAVLSLKSHRFNWPAPYRLLSVLLIFVFTGQTFAIVWPYLAFIKGWPYSPYNLWILNCMLIPQYVLYMAVYYMAIKSATVKRFIVIAAILYIIISFIFFTYFQSIHSIGSYTLLLASIIMILLTVVYFEQIRDDKKIIRLTKHPMVWISLGAFIFHVGDIPFIMGLNYLNEKSQNLADALLYVHLILNIVLYSFYTIAFLCQPPPHK